MVTIERPEVMNALHGPASLELSGVFDDFASDPQLWVAVLTGSGDRAFCAGNDLKALAAGVSHELPPSGFGGLTGRFDLDKPIIAAVNGLALGGGFELALACDLIIMAEEATFGLPEPRVGVAATAGGLLRLPRQMPVKQAMGAILTGRSLTAADATRFGLVNEVVPRAEVLSAALGWADEVQRCSPLAIRAAKQIVRHGLAEADMATVYHRQKALPAALELYGSDDYREGPRAFAEKRPPVWTGR